MNKTNETTKSTSTQRKRLVIIKPNTGDYRKGFTFALQTKDNLTLLGEVELAAWMNSGKKGGKAKAENELFSAAVRNLDFPHILMEGSRLAQLLNLEPCSAITKFGAGAAELCRPYDIAREKMSELRAKVSPAAAAVFAAIKGGKMKDIKASQVAHAAAIKGVTDYEEEYKKIVKNYNRKALQALALIEMLDVRK